jgi:fatty acid desaturase
MFYGSQVVLALSVSKGWLWLSIPLVLLVSHLMHGMLIAFHEASHGKLRKNRFLNDADGVLIGLISFQSFTLYRVLHQSHHHHLATERDAELWPFVKPSSPRWARRLAAFAELTLGLVYTPLLFWRAFFSMETGISNKRVRRRIWFEMILAAVFWSLVITLVVSFSLWPWYIWNYLVPSVIAGNLQSWRKYIEHVGLSENSARGATRSIVADSLGGRLMSITLLHEPLHGVHHLRTGLPHYELPGHTNLLAPIEEGDTAPFPNYRSALIDLLRNLPDPKVGGQWEGEPSAPAKALS